MEITSNTFSRKPKLSGTIILTRLGSYYAENHNGYLNGAATHNDVLYEWSGTLIDTLLNLSPFQITGLSLDSGSVRKHTISFGSITGRYRFDPFTYTYSTSEIEKYVTTRNLKGSGTIIIDSYIIGLSIMDDSGIIPGSLRINIEDGMISRMTANIPGVSYIFAAISGSSALDTWRIVPHSISDIIDSS